ncbi:TPA: DUF2726 domain-containing protein [Salmonella enterica]
MIEVDGGYHFQSVQLERDELKNNILYKSGLPLLRLRTIDSNIEAKLEEFLTGLLMQNGV